MDVVIRVFLLFSLFFTIALTPKAYGRLYIDVTASSIRKLNIAIPDFLVLSGSRKRYKSINRQFQEILGQDLNISGFFNIQNKDLFIEKLSKTESILDINVDDWRIIGTAMLLRCGFHIASSIMKVEMRLFDIIENKKILSKNYNGDIASGRLIAHMMANDIIERLTGKKGFFDYQIVFSRKTTPKSKEIYLMDSDGYGAKPLTSNGSLNLFPSVSTNGMLIAYTSYRAYNPDLYLMDLKKGSIRKILAYPGINTTPAFLPSDKSLIVALSKDGNSELYQTDLTGKILKRLTFSPAEDISPSIAPDGKRVVFVSDRAGGLGLYILNIDSLDVKRLSTGMRYCADPCWSSEGNRIVFSSREKGSFDIYSIQISGSGLLRHTFGEGRNEHPSISPDSRIAAFDSTRGGKRQIYLLNLRSGDVVKISRSSYNESQPFWRRR